MPEAYRPIISPEASSDLAAIHAYISQNSPDNAARMVQRILRAIESLRIIPHRNVLSRQTAK